MKNSVTETEKINTQIHTLLSQKKSKVKVYDIPDVIVLHAKVLHIFSYILVTGCV